MLALSTMTYDRVPWGLLQENTVPHVHMRLSGLYRAVQRLSSTAAFHCQCRLWLRTWR